MTLDLDAPAAVDYRALARRIATEVAAPAAAEVDRDARFPHESFAALRAEGLLSAMIPVELGGAGATVSDMAAVTEELGMACASTGMVFAMHQIQINSLIRHGRSAALDELKREICRDQLLVASATTEVGIGGDVRSSSCHVQLEGDTFRVTKQAPVISYGEQADLLFLTARRNADSPPNDQVLTVMRIKDIELERVGEWNTLGFRGTCSPGFVVRGHGPADLILDDPYGDISARSMLPSAHILWGHLWFGMATQAVNQARAFVRAAARSKPGTVPPGAQRLAELMVVHQQMAELVRGAAARYEATYDDVDAQSSISFAVAMNSLKVSASSLLIDIVGKALVIVGIMGYREDSAYSLGRVLRDAWGAPLMVNNDRILGNNAQLLLVSKD
ncbi:MAG: acyl-CoA dehydrogenase [Frankiales bacterium]|nr:acyl-CoA dehydrogenase [Frankiales bacterium]